jgi:lysophospholipase L1-like esterase
MKKHVLYWLLILPISSILLLEATLQVGSFINQHILGRKHQTQWLTSHLRIVTMGDSNTYGLYLKPEDSYPKQLEKLWNATHKDQPIEVINLGYPGSNSSRIVANIEAAINNLHPDLVLIMIGTNDSWTQPISYAESSLISNKKNLLDWAKSHSKIYRMYCLVARKKINEGELHVVTTSDPKQAESAKEKPATIDYQNLHLDFSMTMRKPEDNFNSDETLLSNIAKLIRYAKASQQRIIFLTYAGNKSYYMQANKIINEAMHRNQYTDFIDITEEFRALQPPKGEGNEYFFADLHATAKGNTLVAEKTMAGIEQLLNSSQAETAK